jgi:acyl carrier protein
MSNATNLSPLALIQEALRPYTDANLEGLNSETRFIDIGIDSLTMAELLFELEDRLGVTLDDSADIPQTVGQVMALVQSHLPAAAQV